MAFSSHPKVLATLMGPGESSRLAFIESYRRFFFFGHFAFFSLTMISTTILYILRITVARSAIDFSMCNY